MEEKNNKVRKTRKRIENSNETIRKKEKATTKTRGEQKGGERTTPRVTSSRRTNNYHTRKYNCNTSWVK